MPTMLYSVITTIQAPTAAVRALHGYLNGAHARLVVVGDAKGPAAYDLSHCEFLGLTEQRDTGFALARTLPTGHYARKNIGYLQAIRRGATIIYETDDDNTPLPSWSTRAEGVAGARCLPAESRGWVNVYRYFTSDPGIWPRGLPLQCIQEPAMDCFPACRDIPAPIQQGLVNGSPDVDAIWRLTQDRCFEFEPRPPLWLGPGQWCPFNTQSTWWWPVAFPLLYVPSACSFRMCDIWKSFIAQRCLWAMGAGVVFHPPEAWQDRNVHNVTRDFESEIPGYLLNDRIARVLEGLTLREGTGHVSDNMRACYTALVSDGIFPPDELPRVDAWLKDIQMLMKDGV